MVTVAPILVVLAAGYVIGFLVLVIERCVHGNLLKSRPCGRVRRRWQNECWRQFNRINSSASMSVMLFILYVFISNVVSFWSNTILPHSLRNSPSAVERKIFLNNKWILQLREMVKVKIMAKKYKEHSGFWYGMQMVICWPKLFNLYITYCIKYTT